MKNPVCNFAIRELTIETNVHVEVTALGTINYRFVELHDDIDPAKLSKLNFSIVPLPKEGTAGSWTRSDFTPYDDIEEIQGIGDAYKRKLNAQNIYTVSDLLNASTRVRSKIELGAMLGVDHSRLTEWVAHAELMTVRSINGQNAEVLYESGIADLSTLADKEPFQVVDAYNARVTKRNQANLKPITETTAQDWIKAARAFCGIKRTIPQTIQPSTPKRDDPDVGRS